MKKKILIAILTSAMLCSGSMSIYAKSADAEGTTIDLKIEDIKDMDDLEDAVEDDVEAVVDQLEAEYKDLMSELDTFDDVLKNEDKIDAYYEKTVTETRNLLIRLREYQLLSAEYIMTLDHDDQLEANEDMFSELVEEINETIYDEIITDLYDDLKDEIQKKLFEDAHNKDAKAYTYDMKNKESDRWTDSYYHLLALKQVGYDDIRQFDSAFAYSLIPQGKEDWCQENMDVLSARIEEIKEKPEKAESTQSTREYNELIKKYRK